MQQDQKIATLIDEIRGLDAQAAGKRMELCLELGERDQAYKYMREMHCQTEARMAARQSGCFAGAAHA